MRNVSIPLVIASRAVKHFYKCTLTSTPEPNFLHIPLLHSSHKFSLPISLCFVLSQRNWERKKNAFRYKLHRILYRRFLLCRLGFSPVEGNFPFVTSPQALSFKRVSRVNLSSCSLARVKSRDVSSRDSIKFCFSFSLQSALQRSYLGHVCVRCASTSFTLH